MLGKLAAVGKVLVGGVEKSVPAWEQEIAAKPGYSAALFHAGGSRGASIAVVH
jgi:hypothetical protein